ncbi:MAG: A/G-specific adenine glycosylase [Microbacteriaceae bacterium]
MDIARVIIDWFATAGRSLPWREPGFSAWGTLVSEFMLQQTPVARVIPRLEEWLRRWPTPADLASVPPGEAVRAWQSLGYPRRALNLHSTAVTITELHGGIVPSDVTQLLALPGVGDYTARAVAVFAFGERHPVVDVNTRRVIARAIHGNGEPGPASKRDLVDMEALLPRDDSDAQLANIAFMELGALVCTARSPKCEACPIAEACAWRAAGYPQFEGTRAPVQATFAGSDRQVRGLIMKRVRSSEIAVTAAEIDAAWPLEVQRKRALKSLLADGLVVRVPGGFELPS